MPDKTVEHLNAAPPTPATPAWTVRGFQPGDEPGLTVLFAESFGKPLTIEHWRWKVKGQPSPVENVWLAADGEAYAGQYGAIPTRISIAGRSSIAMVLVDTMTSPRYRRQGVLTALAQRAYAEWRAAGVMLVMGLPNEKWGSRPGALNYPPFARLIWLQRYLRPDRAFARRLRLPGLVAQLASFAGRGAGYALDLPLVLGRASAQVREAHAAGPEFDLLWTRLSPAYSNLVVRDAAWVRWRYFDAPGFGYRVLLAQRAGDPCGYLALRLHAEDDRVLGIIADLFAAPGDGDTIRSLVRTAVAIFRQAGAEKMMTATISEGALARSLQRLGFWRGPGEFRVHQTPLADETEAAGSRDSSRWFLTGGDFDVV